MNGMTGKLPAKIGAVFLSLICAVVVAASSLAIYGMGQTGVYTDPRSMVWRSVVDDVTDSYMRRALKYYQNGDDPADYFVDTNFRYTIYDEAGAVLSTNESGEAYQFTSHWEDWYLENRLDETGEYIGTIERWVRVDGCVLETLTGSDRYTTMEQMLDYGITLRYWLIVMDVVALVLGALCVIFLFCAAGHRQGQEKLTLNLIDHLPFDIYTAILAFVGTMEVLLLDSMSSIYSVLVWGGILFVVDYLLVLNYMLSLTTRLKIGVFWKKMAVYRLVKFCWRIISKPFRMLSGSLQQLPLIWKSSLALTVICIAELIAIAGSYFSSDLLGFWFVEKLILVPLVVWFMLGLRRLEESGRKLAAGDLSYRVDTKNLRGDLRGHGEDLNSISQGMTLAVEQRLKSERLKTELITNVSHDIKTPLTSIINYVDLMQKEPLENQRMQEYIEVLARQSARLKKLIEDLVEASKASTGNVSVDMQPVEVGVLLNQTAGEYGEKLEACKLELVINQPGEPVWILADGRHLWRVFDNLMNNICKYAMPGTRVYLSLTQQAGKAVMTFRNISKMALNISGEELTERFVRGDSSRNTEGSGLGLSIARSLTELQKGKLDIVVDGDLFKVLLSFDCAPEDSVGPTEVPEEGTLLLSPEENQ